MRILIVLFACGLVAAGVAIAFGTAPADVARPSPKLGRVQSTLCATCHGARGLSVASDIPNLAGQHYEYLMEQLIAFKRGTRQAGVMNEMVKSIPLTELRNIAAYYSSVKISVGSGRAKK